MPKRSINLDWDDFRFVLAVARSGTVSMAARLLGVDHATVVRRIDHIECQLNDKLFVRSRSGYILTPTGQQIADTAVGIESAVLMDQAHITGAAARLTGSVRIGAPDGFGTFFLAPQIGGLMDRYPELEIELVATSRMFSLSKREADIAISLALPKEGRIVGRKLVDYRLALYASADYLAVRTPIRQVHDLLQHRMIGYIDELLFAPELDYLPQILPGLAPQMRSANLVGQLNAARAGIGIAVLPCFIAAAMPDLQPILIETTSLIRSFWLLMHADNRDLVRVRATADYIYEKIEAHRSLFSPAI